MFKSRLVLSLLFCGAVALAGCKAPPSQDVESASTPVSNAVTNSATNAAAPTAKSGLATFENSVVGLQGPLKDHYVGFTFDYPSSWQYKIESGDPAARNFVKVEKQLADKSKGGFTLENFAVGSLKIKNNEAREPKQLAAALKLFGQQLASSYPHYKKIAEGPTQVNGYQGYQLLFESRMVQTTRGEVTLWGRIILLPHPQEAKGVTLIMLASSLEPSIKSAADVGVRGGLPAVLKSFKFQ